MSVDFSELTPAEQFIFKETTRHDRMVQLVEQMLKLHKHLHAAKSQSDRDLYQRQIDATDRETARPAVSGVDQLVYELYGLTDDEIKIIEEPGV